MDVNSRALLFGSSGGATAASFGTAAQNGTPHSSGGLIVLDGYGLLFYIGSSGAYNTWGDYGSNLNAARTYDLYGVTGTPLDITLVGGGGANTSGGGGGGGGGAGVRLVYTPTTSYITLSVGGGMNTHYTTSQNGSTASLPPGQSRLIENGSIIAYAGGGGGSGQVSATFSVPQGNAVYTSTGQNTFGSFSTTTNGAYFSAITAIDTSYQIDRGGNGQYLQGFGVSAAGAGQGLGGGGGGQNSLGYGGNSIPGGGGRYGYGGSSFNNTNLIGDGYNAAIAQAGQMYGYGPSPGESNSHRNTTGQGSYNNGGGGGSFGGGGGDDGSGGNGYGSGGTGGGGAILVRIDTTQGFFTSGRSGWPTSTGPWTG